MLAAVKLENPLPETLLKLEMTPVFDFNPIRKLFKAGSQGFYYQGLAEGFAFDGNGNLLVLLNNRGFVFEKSPDGILGVAPKLLVFTRESGVPMLPEEGKAKH